MSFFKSEEILCPFCQKPLNLWIVFKSLLGEQVFGHHYSLLGCKGKFREIKLKPNETFILDLSDDIGDGDLLYINYTPGPGGVQPIELHSNTPLPHIRQKTIYLYGRPLDNDASETGINCFYWFAPDILSDDLGMRLLLDAFKRYYEDNYRYMVISAFTAVEIAQYGFFSGLLTSSKISYSKKVEPFLTKNATFSSQLRVLLPFLADKMKFPMLPTEVYDGLENLRKDRNDLVHRGKPKKGLESQRIKNELVGALFAFKYYKLMIRELEIL